MTTNKNETFGSLLTAAISYIAACEYKTTAVVEEELGAALGVAGKTVQRYKSGILPPANHERDPFRILAEAIVTRRVGSLGREWLERFLHAARYPAADKLLDELCPALAPRPKPERVYHNLPAPTYDQFVMRQQAFDEVVDGLGQRSAAVLIVGMGGNGKTSLAREVAAQCLQAGDDTPRFDAVVWVSDKDNPGTTNQSTVLDTIARTLDYPGFTQFPHEEKQYEVEQLLRRQRVLLIIDNAETITDGALFTWLLRLPEPSKALITTREYQRLFRRNCTPIELRGMRDDEARTLLQQRLERLRIAHLVHDPAQLEPLRVATGGNPKAITMVAGLLKYERRPLQQIVADLYAARGDLFDDLFSRAWALLDEAGKRILMVMTFFPDSASIEALSATADVTGFDFDRAVERLTDLSLLDVQQEDLNSAPRYVLHPLVRAFAGARLAEQTEFERGARERWVGWYITLSERVGYCPNDLAQLTLLDYDYETLFVAIEWAYRNDRSTEVVRLCAGSMYYFYVRGFWERWFLSNLFRLEIARRLQDSDEEIRALAYQVQMLSRQGHLIQADSYRQELDTITTQQNLDNELFFLVHHCLGAYYLAQDDFDTARNEWQVLLDQEHRLSHYRRTTTLQWLGLCLYFLGDKEQARSLSKLSLDEALQNNYGRYILFNRIRLAAIAIDEGELVQAETELATSERHARFYHDHEQLAYTLGLKARLYAIYGSLVSAQETLIEAIDIFERLGIRRELAEARAELARLEAQLAAAGGQT